MNEELINLKVKQGIMAEKINNIEKQCGEIKQSVADIKKYVEKAAENSVQSHRDILDHVESNFARKYTEKIVYLVLATIVGYIIKDIFIG